MFKLPLIFCTLLFFAAHLSIAQMMEIDRKKFFTEESTLDVTLKTDIRQLVSAKRTLEFQDAVVSIFFPDGSQLSDTARIRPRGEFRRENCYLASLLLDFRNSNGSPLSPLKRMKLVGGCSKASSSEQLLFKEYIIYKMYNLFTDMSFRVRLLRINYEDMRGKVKPYTQYGFFIEDVDDMAKRNDCREIQDLIFGTEQTDREYMTMMSIFQYMIGNTDWAVPVYHNVKLLVPRDDSLAMPYAVPYDFDHNGFVNAWYAIPPEILGLSSIRERAFRGFPRTFEEVKKVADIFLEKESRIRAIIDDFELLDNSHKRDAHSYIDDFFKIMKDDRLLRLIFIDNARTK